MTLQGRRSGQRHSADSKDSKGTDVRLYTPAEAAAMLRVRESWLRKKASARVIPCTFIGKHLRFSEHDVTAIVAAGAKQPLGRRGRARP
ncbi:helix-turn-helix domain-containing protein [Actinomadura terrae]|uniref:helix-turn-helix domain-containing protein n=1 Tax=Actinomadura terrae TaxID=604353 RepID=UPI001FA818D8|nr:helix-turn-helix domain-containing protein [Actinomadura terrae]